MSSVTPKRILFIRPSALGDICRSVPVVARLKKKWPDASIDWLVRSEFVEAVNAHPAVDQVIPFQRQALKRWYFPKGFVKMISFLRSLKSNKYDLVIDGQGLGRSGLFAWATGSPIRIGLASAREFGWLGYTEKVQTTSEHTVDQMLSLCNYIGASDGIEMELYCNANDSHWWGEYREANAIEEYAVIAPTSRWKSKQWPIERFASVAQHLQDLGVHVVVVGAPTESSQVSTLLELDGITNLLPSMTVGRMMAVIAPAKIVIANDSAALHMAVGFNRTLIGLFGPTEPRKVGPYNKLDSVIAANVDYNAVHYRDRALGTQAIEQIETSEVLAKVDQLLKVMVT
ncbi:glycosyltransferase family 9 protein [bacterium]|nr:glycosyltransferase family 9 protein [bacterium]